MSNYHHIDDHFVRRALGEMECSLREIPSIHVLCLNLGISRTYFQERFTRVMGQPPGRYLRRYRAERARQLIRKRPQLPLRVAARSVGYSCGEVMNRAFRREFGCTPGQIRREEHEKEGEEER